MTKLYYPSDGIYKYCKDSINNCSSNLSNAILNCKFNVPAGFIYKNYLNNLSSYIGKFYKEIENIDSKLRLTNNNFEALDDDLTSNKKKMVTIKIKERDRMIY